MNLVSTLGIDLAKNTFSVHGVNSHGAVVLRRSLSRTKLSELVAQLQPCLIGMEACSGAWLTWFRAQRICPACGASGELPPNHHLEPP